MIRNLNSTHYVENSCVHIQYRLCIHKLHNIIIITQYIHFSKYAYICTVLFVENQPVGGQSVSSWSMVSHSVVYSVSCTVSRSAKSLSYLYVVLNLILKEKDGVLEEGVQVSISTVHHWQNELGWSSKCTKYCQLIWEANLEKRLLVTRSINHHSVGQSVGRSVSRSVSQLTPINWPVFYKKYCILNVSI